MNEMLSPGFLLKKKKTEKKIKKLFFFLSTDILKSEDERLQHLPLILEQLNNSIPY